MVLSQFLCTRTRPTAVGLLLTTLFVLDRAGPGTPAIALRIGGCGIAAPAICTDFARPTRVASTAPIVRLRRDTAITIATDCSAILTIDSITSTVCILHIGIDSRGFVLYTGRVEIGILARALYQTESQHYQDRADKDSTDGAFRQVACHCRNPSVRMSNDNCSD